MKRRLTLSVVALAVVSAAQANLLVNGSFEVGPSGDYYAGGNGDSTVAGWVGMGTGYEWFKPATVYGGVLNSTASDQLACVDLANLTNSYGDIKQSFATVIGQQYELKFDLSTSTYAGRNGFGPISASVDTSNSTTTSMAFSVTNNQVPLVWTTFSMPFTAQDTTCTLRFESFFNANEVFSFVDNARVTAVPEPGSLMALAIGALMIRRVKK
ncbi:MAG: DUF642 domain-containing protein [Chthonomonas sp.]|nr:DUF642 domain-containing protein [Chthonomonas sp.]